MRLRLAVLKGVLGLALLLAPAPGEAQSLLEFLFGPAPTPQQAAPSGADSAPSRRARGQGASKPRAGSAFATDPNAGGFCVRTCDGYFFPLIKSTRATRQQSCELACPSAAMDVYDGSSIETARNRKGQRYSALPRAFAFRDKAGAGSCACNDPGTSQAYFERAGKDDPTLQSGDILVEANGAFVYKRAQLVPLADAALSPALRTRLRAMLRHAPAEAPALTGAVEAAPPALDLGAGDPTGSTTARQTP